MRNYHDLMDLTEELVKFVAMEVNGTTTTRFNGRGDRSGELDAAFHAGGDSRSSGRRMLGRPATEDFASRGRFRYGWSGIPEAAGSGFERCCSSTIRKLILAGNHTGRSMRSWKIARQNLAAGEPYGKTIAAIFEYVAEEH